MAEGDHAEGDGAEGDHEAPQWLDAEELEAWVQVALLLTHLPGELDSQLQRDSGLTHFEYEVLSVLSDSDGRRQRLSDLAVLAGGSQSRLSHVVTRLERRGWVRRAPSPDDARVTYAHLTDGGLAKVIAAASGYVRNVRSLVIDRLTRSQVAALAEIGERLNAEVPRLS